MRYAAEDCPVNRMKDRDAGAWDAQALCGLFQCPGCGLTPDHPLMTSGAGWRRCPRRTGRYRSRQRAGRPRRRRPARRRSA